MNTKELIDRIFKEPGIKFELNEFENLGKPIHDIITVYPKTAATGKDAGQDIPNCRADGHYGARQHGRVAVGSPGAYARSGGRHRPSDSSPSHPDPPGPGRPDGHGHHSAAYRDDRPHRGCLLPRDCEQSDCLHHGDGDLTQGDRPCLCAARDVRGPVDERQAVQAVDRDRRHTRRSPRKHNNLQNASWAGDRDALVRPLSEF